MCQGLGAGLNPVPGPLGVWRVSTLGVRHLMGQAVERPLAGRDDQCIGLAGGGVGVPGLDRLGAGQQFRGGEAERCGQAA